MKCAVCGQRLTRNTSVAVTSNNDVMHRSCYKQKRRHHPSVSGGGENALAAKTAVMTVLILMMLFLPLFVMGRNIVNHTMEATKQNAQAFLEELVTHKTEETKQYFKDAPKRTTEYVSNVAGQTAESVTSLVQRLYAALSGER